MAYPSDVVRQPADWMRPADEWILETVREDGNMTPLALSRDGEVERLDYASKYLGVRCRRLTEAGLLERVDRGLFTITDLGERYLDDELTADEVEALEAAVEEDE